MDASAPVAVVGGGITGLFCAYVLAHKGYTVHLYESSDRVGGRIRSVRLTHDHLKDCETATEKGTAPQEREDSPKNGGKAAWRAKDLDFCAEFGPMRIELDVQVLVKALLARLEIEGDPKVGEEETGAASAYLEPFPAFSSPTTSSDPKYELRPEEEGRNPLELLQLAILRVVLHLKFPESSTEPSYQKKKFEFDGKQRELITEVELAAATQEPVEPVFLRWLKSLDEGHYWFIQNFCSVDGVELYRVGFWNLVSYYLSHDALTKMRDLGSFYHLLPDNPNAAEWVVWWLRGFSISNRLQGVCGGMESIIQKLQDKTKGLEGSVKIRTGCEVVKISPPTGGRKLVLTLNEKGSKKNKEETFTPRENGYDHVILALPKMPVEKIIARSVEVVESQKGKANLDELLESAFGFPMVKVFVVVKDRWWEEENRANWYATRFPTREVHYWKGREDSKRGMIMLYTDRPASSFWSDYVPAGAQDDVDELYPREGDGERAILRKRLLTRVVRYINENNVPDITPDDIIWCGVWDWGRRPYGAGNHAWRPGWKYWVAMRRLADISFDSDATDSRIHICGEAYSDYHGFIEGSLRSATYALHRILRNADENSDPNLQWLEKVLWPNGIGSDIKYYSNLQTWVENLDGIDEKESYLPTSAPKPQLAYGAGPDGLLFIERGLAEELATLRRGFDTWGDAREALTQSRWNEIVAIFENAEKRLPDATEAFDLDNVPGFANGDWPEWPARLMLDWMPKKVVEQFGRVEDSVLNGPFLSVDPRAESAIVAALEAEGWSCVKDEPLVLTASGYDLR